MLVSFIIAEDHRIVKGTTVEDLSRRGQDDGERDVFPSILWNVLLLYRARSAGVCHPPRWT